MSGWKQKFLPEMTIDIPGVFDSLTDEAGNAVQELNLGTVWNEWNTNWTSVDIAGTEITHRERERRAQWPFIRDEIQQPISTEILAKQELV